MAVRKAEAQLKAVKEALEAERASAANAQAEGGKFWTQLKEREAALQVGRALGRSRARPRALSLISLTHSLILS
eukprot:5498559-Pleurochrysis_carterae.AAC.1